MLGQSLSGGKIDPTDESVLHAALNEAEEMRGNAAGAEILGRLSPPLRSLSCLRAWPYIVSSKYYIRVSAE